MLAHAHEDACHRREGAAGLRPRRRRRARRNRPDRARLGAADDRRERRLPGPLPACRRRVRGRADQYRRRHGRRRPHVGRGRHRRGRPGGPHHPGRREAVPLRRSGDRDRGRHRAWARKPARLAAPGADPFRRRPPAAPARCRARRLGCPDARRERGVRPGRDGRGRRKRELPRPLADTPRRPAGFCRGRQVGRLRGKPSREKRSAAGGRALATVLHLAGDAEARRDAARAALEDARCECGVGAWNGMLVARFLSPDPQALRADLARFLEFFRGTPMPRSWQT